LARTATKKSTLTTAPAALQRQAKRLTRQQKRLEQELMVSAPLSETVPTTRSRGITLKDLKRVEPMTDRQHDFFNGYDDSDAIMLSGSAGTGKSFIALYLALQDVLSVDSVYDRIIILRSVAQSRNMGHLPGTESEKIAVFEEPYKTICSKLLGRKDAYEKLKDMGRITFLSTSFLRGETFDNSIIIFDEFQNETFDSISTVCTRYGKDSKLILIGDGAQTDISKQRNDMSGFNQVVDVAYSMPKFSIYKFTSDDIVRSGFVKQWIVACENLGLM
jgi:phosphate starvation-inducible protein PhoH and related proteins